MINTESLRSKILSFAMRGELSKREDNDGNAKDLYSHILMEKTRLVKKGELRKDKKYNDIKPEELPFTIPDNWHWVRFGKIINLQSGQDLNSFDYNSDEKGIPYITGASNYTDDGRIIINRWTENPKAFAKKNDILLSCKGTVGKLAILKEDKVHIARQIMGIRTFCIDVSFAYYYVQSMLYGIKEAQKGLIPGIERNDVLDLICPLPPVAEQTRIVDAIASIFSLLDIIDDLQTRYAADCDVLKGKLIDAAICGKLTKQLPEDDTAEDLYKKIQEEKKQIFIERKGHADKKIKEIDADVPFTIPTQWKWIRFGDVGLFKKGPFGSALTKSMFVPKSDNTVKVYEQQHAIKKNCNLGTYYIKREYFDSDMSGFEVLPGDIIVSCAGTIGETYIMPDEIEQGIINQALMRVTLAAGIDKRFFQYYFDANLKKSAQDESNGSAIKNIPPFDVMKNWYFPLPPFAEQQRIVETLDNLLCNLAQ